MTRLSCCCSSLFHRLLFLSAVILACGLPPSAAATPTSCTSAEDVVFSCKTGKKSISVCSVRDQSGGGTALRYRFGPPAAAELELSSGSGEGARATVSGGQLAFSGGGGAWLRFRQGTTDYVVYTAIGAQWGEQSGVVPEQGGKPLHGSKCEGKVKSTIGPDLFKRAGIPHDETNFEIPN